MTPDTLDGKILDNPLYDQWKDKKSKREAVK
ncbi:MAG: hypothetical protein QG613_1035 [Pseudomonadota bacterium]|nr:hypothetical protein [Pseudomonadota bacterium]